MIRTWRIAPTENLQLETDAPSLDQVTRQLPEGYYSTFRTFDGGTRVLGLTSHLQRLYKPVTTPEMDKSTLRQRLSALMQSYRPGEARVRAIMTAEGQIYLSIAPLLTLPHDVYEKGVHVETTELHREHPQLKSTSFIGRSDSERKHIAQEGIFEALLVKDGKILEGMTSNFFYVVGRDASRVPPYLGTARSGILLGITRETVLEVGRERGLTIKYKPLKMNQLEEISEAFITSSSRGVVPVTQIDNITIGQGRPGPITKKLSAGYDARVLEIAEEI